MMRVIRYDNILAAIIYVEVVVAAFLNIDVVTKNKNYLFSSYYIYEIDKDIHLKYVFQA